MPKPTKTKTPLVVTTIAWDWKSSPTEDELRAALAPLGVVVLEHPAFEGTDMLGFLLSNRKLTEAELRAECPEDEVDDLDQSEFESRAVLFTAQERAQVLAALRAREGSLRNQLAGSGLVDDDHVRGELQKVERAVKKLEEVQ